jgi:3-oxoadipate enol-lactonase
MPFFHNENIQLHWESLGEGEPVAFLNGILMSVDSWKLQTLEISRHYRCLMHDFRGQLLSSKPDAPWTLEDHAADFEALLDHLEVERCHVVGTSYGGEVGMIFAARRPERVRSLTVIASVSELGADTEGIVRDWRRAALEAPESLYRTMLPATFSPEFIAANPRLLEQGEERLLSCDAEFFRAFADLVEAFCKVGITHSLDRIRCPSLIIAGENDRLKPPHYSQTIAEGISNSVFTVAPGAGHAVILEQPEWINARLMTFLKMTS